MGNYFVDVYPSLVASRCALFCRADRARRWDEVAHAAVAGRLQDPSSLVGVEMQHQRSVTSFTVIGWAVVLLGFSLPISTAFDNLLLGVIFLGWLVSGDWAGKLQRVRGNPVAVSLLVLVAMAALGAMWGEGSVQERLRHFNKYANLLLAVMLIALPLPQAYLRRAWIAFVSAMMLTLVISLAIKTGWLSGTGFNMEHHVDNPVVFKKHITQGLFMSIACSFFTVMSLCAESWRRRWLFAVGALLTATGTLIIDGRIGHLTLVVIAVYLMIHRFRWRGVAYVALAGVMAVIALMQYPDFKPASRFILGFQEIQRWEYGRPDESSMGLRMQFYATSSRVIIDNPLLGVGTGGFESAYRKEISSTAVASTDNPHNQYLMTAVQLGVPGLIAFLAVFVVAWRAAVRVEMPWRPMARGLLLVFLVGNLFNSFLIDHAESIFFAWMLGLFYATTPQLIPQGISVEGTTRS